MGLLGWNDASSLRTRRLRLPGRCPYGAEQSHVRPKPRGYIGASSRAKRTFLLSPSQRTLNLSGRQRQAVPAAAPCSCYFSSLELGCRKQHGARRLIIGSVFARPYYHDHIVTLAALGSHGWRGLSV